jgi:hypothetical protein
MNWFYGSVWFVRLKVAKIIDGDLGVDGDR